MVDLREKIQQKIEYYSQTHKKAYEKTTKEKDTSLIEMHEVGEYEGQKIAYENCINLLNQYNVITTPKTINLSEIIDKLNKIDKSNKFKAIIKVSDTVVIENSEFKKEYFYVKENKIFDLSAFMVKSEYKWLFNLWTTNTEIIDDIGEVLND